MSLDNQQIVQIITMVDKWNWSVKKVANDFNVTPSRIYQLLREFYLTGEIPVIHKRGSLARKLLILVWHLLTKKGTYEDPGYRPKKEVSIPGSLKLVKKIGVDEAINIIETARAINRKMNVSESEIGRFIG